jgi:trans-L-3-hydroxyproline dehydratase
MHNEGYSTGCGHGIIAITTVAVETGLLAMTSPETRVKIDAPSGLVTAYARIAAGRVQSVYFHNVPSFVLVMDEAVDVPGIGKVRYDIAYGGAFYAFVQAEEVGVRCRSEDVRALIEKGMAIKRAIMAARPIPHPFEEDLSFLYGTIFIGPPQEPGAHSRNVCIFAEGEVDRSPTGTGVSARLAIHHARGEISLNEPIPEVEGTAYITGRHEFLIDPNDPLRNGFLLG